MIRITVELISANDKSRDAVLGIMEIANDGRSSSTKYGDYNGRILRKPVFKNIVREGRVENHNRISKPIWSLVAKMLNNMGYNE